MRAKSTAKVASVRHQINRSPPKRTPITQDLAAVRSRKDPLAAAGLNAGKGSDLDSGNNSGLAIAAFNKVAETIEIGL